jgi:hypothetical protein
MYGKIGAALEASQLAPAPGTGLGRPETTGQKRPSPDPGKLQRPHAPHLNREKARKFGGICQRPGNGGSYKTAWWAREDSNLQPERYERKLAFELE